MIQRICLVLWLLIPAANYAQPVALNRDQYKQDFRFFCKTIDEEYAYFGKKQTHWERVSNIYEPALDTISGRDGFVTVLERALYELYDHHAILNTNTRQSQRLVPSGTDIWAEYVDGKPVVTELRDGFGSKKAGILPGMEVISINGEPVEKAILPFLPQSADRFDPDSKSFALRLALAGNHYQPRKLTLKWQGRTVDFFPDKDGLALENIHFTTLLDSRLIGGIGYIRIHDCLYDNGLIALFDSTMAAMKNTDALILDLRETPSGGNTTVARAILGWFISEEHFYQKHEYYAEEKAMGIKRSWEEIVSPRKGKFYGRPLVVLADHWTGSIAEGIVIGFDALKRPNTTIAGTEMARLNGAVYSFELPASHIRFTFPAERLYHINGQPREFYRPPLFIDWKNGDLSNNSDVILDAALQYLGQMRKSGKHS